MELESDNVDYCVASVRRWDQVEEVRKVIREKDLKKKLGWSYIKVKGTIQGFVSRDRSHPKVDEIHKMLAYLSRVTQKIHKGKKKQLSREKEP